MHPDSHLVIQLQSLDQRISALEKEVAALPKHIAAIEKTLESHQRKLEADRGALTANQKDRKKLEGEVQVQEQKISSSATRCWAPRPMSNTGHFSTKSSSPKKRSARPRTASWS